MIVQIIQLYKLYNYTNYTIIQIIQLYKLDKLRNLYQVNKLQFGKFIYIKVDVLLLANWSIIYLINSGKISVRVLGVFVTIAFQILNDIYLTSEFMSDLYYHKVTKITKSKL